MELYEAIRREYEFGVGTIAGVARKLGVHRRMVREALAGAIPKERPAPARARPSLGPLVEFIDAIIEADRHAPRKQRHTAHRIYTRICQERAECPVAESTVRAYVRERRRSQGAERRETFVPQGYAPGAEAQVDWYSAQAELGGEREVLSVFVMRSMYSGAAFHRAYKRATQQAFLEGHQLAFHHFEGVFARLRYDNLPQALKRVLRGSRREETARFVAFRSHWCFEADFCTPGQPHEKGGVENEVGQYRRNHWTPLPKAATLAALNEELLSSCREDEARTVSGKTQTVGTALLLECEQLLPLAGEDFELDELSFPIVSKLGTARVRTNAYSLPLRAGTRVEARVTPLAVEFYHAGRRVASHERSYGHQQEVLDLEHYLDLLEERPGALAQSRPLTQWRELGRWPESYDRYWGFLKERYGREEGTRQLIGLLKLGRERGQERLRQVIEEALSLGCRDASAVRYLLCAEGQMRREHEAFVVPASLERFERPLPSLGEYDRLLEREFVL